MKIEVKECFWCPLRGDDGDGKGSVWSVCQATLRREGGDYSYELQDLDDLPPKGEEGIPYACPLRQGDVTVSQGQIE